jgi:hypothetical protein
MAYGGLLNLPASIAALIRGAYVDDPVPFRAAVRRERQRQYARFSERDAVRYALIGGAARPETPITGQDLIAAGGCGVGITSSPSASDT